MDETEITNNEYRQFVNWVRDSIARTLLGEVRPDVFLIEENEETGEIYDPPFLNWEDEIEWNSEDAEIRDILEELYLPEHERYFRRKEIDTRLLNYEYYWIDLQAAAKKQWNQDVSKNYDGYELDGGKLGMYGNRPDGLNDRSIYVRKEVINVYPDTLAWIHDYTYSFNDPITEKYFWHPAYDHYPVVGVTWKQAKAFCVWRTQYLDSKRGKKLAWLNSDFQPKLNGNGLPVEVML